jgi:addiction module HigA family antidote
MAEMTIRSETQADGPFPLEGETIAFHPGEFLREELEARDLTPERFAAEISRTPESIAAILSGSQPLTAELAVEIEEAFGIDAELWVNLQGHYDLQEARRRRAAS